MAIHAEHPGRVRRHSAVWRGERPWPAVPLPPGVESWDECLFHEKRTFSLPVLKHELLLVLAGVVVVAIVAFLVAPFVSSQIGVGLLPAAFLLAVYIGFLTIPVWIAAILDDVEDHAEEIEERAGRSAEPAA